MFTTDKELNMNKVPTQKSKMTAKAGVNHAIKGQPKVGSAHKENHTRTQKTGLTAGIHRGFKTVKTKAGIAGK